MKTKPNFTYKQFIQKISQTDSNTNEILQNKTPRTLKSQNKNISSASVMHTHKPLEKRNNDIESAFKKNSTSKLTPRRIEKKENKIQAPVFKQTSRTNLKNTTNKKFQSKNQPNFSQQTSRKQSLKQSNRIQNQNGGNFSYNQSCFEQERHNESCSTFYRNFIYENEEQNFHNKSIGLSKSPSTSSRLKSKKHSTSSIESKIKIQPKGNITERNGQRVNTQYEERRCMVTDRLNTQYEKDNSRDSRQSPSFYKLSGAESSFLDFEEDKSHNNLFAESSVSRTKKSSISLVSDEKSAKINQKSYELVYNNFMTKISETLFRITRIEDQNKLLDHKIKYIEFLECLKELKMIQSDYEPYSQVQGVDLVKEFWEELVMGHNINHFIIVVALILKVTPIEQVDSDDPYELQNYLLLQKKYQQFRFTRLQLDKSKTLVSKESPVYCNFPLKPTISKLNEEISSKQKSQRKFKINASVNHTENSHLQSRGENISISSEFQNNNQRGNSPSVRPLSPLGNKRSQLLYKQARKKSLQKKGNQSTIDYQYEKNKEELTFKPKILIKRKKPQTQDSLNNYLSPRFAMDEQKTINRMIRGRVQKQVKQMTIDKGIPYNEKTVQKLRKQKFEEIFKEQQQSRLKKHLNQSSVKMKVSQVQEKTPQSTKDRGVNNRCTTQVENLQNLLNLSFEDLHKIKPQQKEDQVESDQCSARNIPISPLRRSSLRQQQACDTNYNDEPQLSPQDFFTLDIYFQQDRSQKLMIRRDSGIQDVVSEAERFVQKHNLPPQMGVKLKQQLMIAMKFHDIQKIEQNDEEQECSLLG